MFSSSPEQLRSLATWLLEPGAPSRGRMMSRGAPLRRAEGLFVSQSDDGIDAQRSARRDVAREQGDDTQN